jgi:hypothetical protein
LVYPEWGEFKKKSVKKLVLKRFLALKGLFHTGEVGVPSRSMVLPNTFSQTQHGGGRG